MGKRELVALLNLSSWCLVMVEGLFLAVPRGCLQFVIVAFSDHTHYFSCKCISSQNRWMQQVQTIHVDRSHDVEGNWVHFM